MESVLEDPLAKGRLRNTTWWKVVIPSYENGNLDEKLPVMTDSQRSTNLSSRTKAGIDGIPSFNGRRLRNGKLFARQVDPNQENRYPT